MGFKNVGGSIGNGCLIVAFLWSLRWYTNFARNRPATRSHRTLRKMPRFVGNISPSALKYVVEQDVVRTRIIDLRSEALRLAAPLPSSEQFQAIIAVVNPADLSSALKDSTSWKVACPTTPEYPTLNHMLVFVTPDDVVMEEASGIAVTCNFQRCLHLRESAAGVADSVYLPQTKINRDATAHLLALKGQESAPVDFTFIDLRRHDERSLYGGILGSVHIPVETFVFAIQNGGADFEADCHMPKPPTDKIMILQCRSNKRAGWAAHLAAEQGYTRVFVYTQGSFGWRVDTDVKAYPSYELGSEPPETENFEVEHVDPDTAVKELRDLGIMPRD